MPTTPRLAVVIIAETCRGDGLTRETAMRTVLQVFDTDGTLIAESDPHAEAPHA